MSEEEFEALLDVIEALIKDVMAEQLQPYELNFSQQKQNFINTFIFGDSNA